MGSGRAGLGKVTPDLAPARACTARKNRSSRLRTQVVNSITQRWPTVCGMGSMLQVHLVGLLVLAIYLRGLVGCGITKQKVSQLCQTLEKQGLNNSAFQLLQLAGGVRNHPSLHYWPIEWQSVCGLPTGNVDGINLFIAFGAFAFELEDCPVMAVLIVMTILLACCLAS